MIRSMTSRLSPKEQHSTKDLQSTSSHYTSEIKLSSGSYRLDRDAMAPASEFRRFPDLPPELRLRIWTAALPGPRLVKIKQRLLKKTIGEWEVETRQLWPIMQGDLEMADQSKDKNERRDDADEEGNEAGSDRNSTYGPWWPYANEIEHRRVVIREDLAFAVRVSGEDLSDKNIYNKANLVGIFSECSTTEIMFACREARAVFLRHYTPVFSCTGSFPQTYFDFEIDTLYLNHHVFSHYSNFEGLASVRHDIEDRLRIEDTENLKRIERLAVLVDPEDYTPIDPKPKEEVLADILRTFGGVRQFSLIAEDFADFLDDELSLIDPIDIEKAITVFKDYCVDIATEELKYGHILPGLPQLDITCAELNMSDFERFRQIHCRAGRAWAMPDIKIQAVAVLDDVLELEQARSECEATIERFDEYMARLASM